MKTKLNRTDYILLGIFYTILFLLEVYNYYADDSYLIEYLVDIPSTIILSFVVIILFMYWLIPKYLVVRPQYLLFSILGISVLTVAGMIEFTAGFWSGGNDWSNFPNWHRFFVLGLLSGADSAGIVFGLLLTKKFYEGQTEIAKVQQQQKENELKLLRSQLDPHFLFNNLNTLDALIDSDATKAKEYVNRLSLIYRYLIQTKDAEVMELSEELNLAKNYIFLIQTRFGDDYDFTFDKKTAILDKFLPTGALQAVLENVVKHNKANKNKTVKATITIEEDWLSVSNQKSKTSNGTDSLETGLDNLKSRYRLLSDESPIITESETQFKIAIPIITLVQV